MSTLDNREIEHELLSLLKMSTEQLAIIKTKHEVCSTNVGKELEAFKIILKTKFDKEDGDELIKEIDKIKKILKVDNSDNIERNFNILNSVVNYIVYSIAIITVLSGVIVGILHIAGVF